MTSSMQRSASADLLGAVDRVRFAITVVVFGRAILCAIGAALTLWISSMFAWSLFWNGTSRTTRVSVTLIDSVLVGAFVLWLLARRFGRVSRVRAALWIEEQRSSGFALVTWTEQIDAKEAPSALLEREVLRLSHELIDEARLRLQGIWLRQLRGPALFAFGAVALLTLHQFSRNAEWDGPIANRTGSASREARSDAPFAAWRVRITPPAYSNLASQSLGNVVSVRALSGSRLDVEGTDATPDSVLVHILRDSQPAARIATIVSLSNGWRTTVNVVDAPMEVRVSREPHTRLLLVEGIADSIPQVTLVTPARDSVLRRAEGRFVLTARAHDDLGLTSASFEIVVSSGEGERFTVHTDRVGARALNGVRDVDLNASLDLTAMALVPGDIVHIRAVARDAHPVEGHEAGASETRSFRIARPSDYDSVAVEPAPPPEVDKSLLSQRMLLLLTERLDAKRSHIATSVWHEEAYKLARDQARLREAVGDAVFQRLNGDGAEKTPAAENGRGGDASGKLNLSGVDATGTLQEGEDSPVIAINKPLLEAYNAMWDAGRALEQAELRAAIPHMKLALAAIERARAASRLYLRGRPPTVIVDIAKVRMVGKDTGAPQARRARGSLPPSSALRETRLLAFAELVLSSPAAARDSLALLRLESLADAPAFAESLNALLGVLASVGQHDLTEPFVRARRVLGGIERTPVRAWSRSGPP